MRQPKPLHPRQNITRDLLDIGRRLLRRGVGNVTVRACFHGCEAVTVTDRDGYFRFDLPVRDRRANGLGGWQDVSLELVGEAASRVTARVFLYPPGSRCLIVSDIDDTVVETGVANRLVMIWRLFVLGPRSRAAVPGFAELLRAAQRGPRGDERNPVVFVSRAPWTIYETLDAFFRLQRFPRDSVLFLREWGLRWYRPVARRDRAHKLALIRHLLALAPDLPAVLIGDSGQEDAEIYASVVAEFPGRVAAVLIRDLDRSPERGAAIRSLEIDLGRAGARLVVATSSVPMAEALAELGLIQRAAVAQVRAAVG
jgi:phosphatidate phosphatase APP1